MSSEAVTMLVAERSELAELCRQLTPEEWNASSLCEGWRVRDVVAHLIGSYQDFKELVKSAGNVHKLNEQAVAKRRAYPTSRLETEMLQSIEPPTLLKIGPMPNILLLDSWVHHQDIRWPLNLPRRQEQARMLALLKIALRSGPGAKRVQGMRLVANDFDWAHGTGAEIVGPSEALVMMLAARPSAWDRLEGAGVARARTR